MTGNQVVSTKFDIRNSIHMVRIVSFGDWNEDTEWSGVFLNMCISSCCDEILFEVMTWIHIVCLVAMFRIDFE